MTLRNSTVVRGVLALAFAACLAVGGIGCAENTACCKQNCSGADCKDKMAQKCPPDCKKPCCKKA